jgi:hypothetical protein
MLKIYYDHIHFLIRYIPRWSIAQIVRRLKQQSTSQIWQLHPSTLRKQYWYQSILWSDGYFVCSIGEASPDTIRPPIHFGLFPPGGLVGGVGGFVSVVVAGIFGFVGLSFFAIFYVSFNCVFNVF